MFGFKKKNNGHLGAVGNGHLGAGNGHHAVDGHLGAGNGHRAVDGHRGVGNGHRVMDGHRLGDVPRFPRSVEEVEALSAEESEALCQHIRARQRRLFEARYARYFQPTPMFDLGGGIYGGSDNHYPDDFDENPSKIDAENLRNDAEMVNGDMWLGILRHIHR